MKKFIIQPLILFAISAHPLSGLTEKMYTTQKNDREACSKSTRSFISELAAENGIYLAASKCTFFEITDMGFVYFDMPNRNDSWTVFITYNPMKLQFINSGNQYVMCIQKRNGDFENIGKRCN